VCVFVCVCVCVSELEIVFSYNKQTYHGSLD
jgi:hypothetical protein